MPANRPSRTAIEKRAIEVYGAPHQILKCIEECAELIEALGAVLNISGVIIIFARHIKKICKARLKVENPITMSVSKDQRKHIIEETADVTLTTDQMKMIFGSPLIVEDAKLTRLAGGLGMIEAVGESR